MKRAMIIGLGLGFAALAQGQMPAARIAAMQAHMEEVMAQMRSNQVVLHSNFLAWRAEHPIDTNVVAAPVAAPPPKQPRFKLQFGSEASRDPELFAIAVKSQRAGISNMWWHTRREDLQAALAEFDEMVSTNGFRVVTNSRASQAQ